MSTIRNPVKEGVLHEFRNAYRKTKAPIWRDAEKKIQKSRSRRAEVNLGKIDKVTNEKDAVLVTGKVLGAGVLTHGIVVGAYSFSQTALSKITSNGGEALLIPEFISRYPKGSGVIFIDR